MCSKTHNFVIGLEKSVPLVLTVADCTLLSNIPLSNDARKYYPDYELDAIFISHSDHFK